MCVYVSFSWACAIAAVVFIELTNSGKLRTSHIAYKCQYCDCLALLAQCLCNWMNVKNIQLMFCVQRHRSSTRKVKLHKRTIPLLTVNPRHNRCLGPCDRSLTLLVLSVWCHVQATAVTAGSSGGCRVFDQCHRQTGFLDRYQVYPRRLVSLAKRRKTNDITEFFLLLQSKLNLFSGYICLSSKYHTLLIYTKKKLLQKRGKNAEKMLVFICPCVRLQ